MNTEFRRYILRMFFFYFLTISRCTALPKIRGNIRNSVSRNSTKFLWIRNFWCHITALTGDAPGAVRCHSFLNLFRNMHKKKTKMKEQACFAMWSSFLSDHMLELAQGHGDFVGNDHSPRDVEENHVVDKGQPSPVDLVLYIATKRRFSQMQKTQSYL